jgi:RNA polymerase sigma factor (sigma-70 family)
MSGNDGADRRRFLTTQWSVVLAATGDDSGAARTALSDLCASYWYPLYAFERRRGTGEHDAQDLVQSFFAVLLEKDYLRAADRERGRFRTFLLTAFKHHASKERDKLNAQKRGGLRTHLTLDFRDGERRYQREPTDDLTPDRIYERRWALTLLDHALERLEESMRRDGRERVFAALSPFLAAGSLQPTYSEAAAAAGLSESAVKSAIRRLRGAYRDALREEIGRTVPDDEAVDDEIRHLMEAVAT